MSDAEDLEELHSHYRHMEKEWRHKKEDSASDEAREFAYGLERGYANAADELEDLL